MREVGREIEHGVGPAEAIEIVEDGRIFESTPQKNTVEAKVVNRDGNRRRLEQTTELEVFCCLRLASGEVRKSMGVGECEGNGVVERSAEV